VFAHKLKKPVASSASSFNFFQSNGVYRWPLPWARNRLAFLLCHFALLSGEIKSSMGLFDLFEQALDRLRESAVSPTQASALSPYFFWSTFAI